MRTEKSIWKTAGIPAIVSAFAFLLVACGGTGAGSELGTAIPGDQPVVKLADVLAAPAGYNGEKIVMKGTVSAQCASLCEFTFKDGVNAALIYPQGFKLPKLKVGTPVTMYAEITSGSENVVVTALGLRLEQGGA